MLDKDEWTMWRIEYEYEPGNWKQWLKASTEEAAKAALEEMREYRATLKWRAIRYVGGSYKEEW